MKRFASALPAPLSALVATALLAGAASAQTEGAEIEGFRTQVEKWVETRQIISEEKSDWDVERETLRATRDLMKQEKTALEAEIQELTESSTAADEERNELLLRRGDSQRAAGVLEAQIRGMEEQVLALTPELPKPLQKKLEPLLVQIPEDPKTSRQGLGQRLMNVLGVLAQTEKWNNTATFVGETRDVGGDQKVQVRTLYWGLGQAFYVDAQGRNAGVGRPGSGGWVFADDPDLADDTALLLDIYEGNVDTIEFVNLPVEIQ
ncbi:MAG: DUF3450 family protein [Myxococcota bacterium]|nr:DUF3450 family protein [Myxococcota bacterium]